MPEAQSSRVLPVAAAARIGVAATNRSAAYASHWLKLLGCPAQATADSGQIVIVGGDPTADSAEVWPDADCVIRLWDFQVGRTGNGALASAVSGASAVIGYPGQAGVALPVDMPEKWCGAYGVILALAELWRQRDGKAKRRTAYDVSAADVLRAFSLQNAGNREEMARNWRRNGRRCVDHGGIFPMGFFACKDGHVAILGRSRRDWRNIQKAIGDPGWAAAAAFEDPFAVARDSAQADRLLEATLAEFGRDELLERGLAHGAVIAPVYSQEEARQRGIFRQSFIVDDGPAMPFLVTPLDAKRRSGGPPARHRSVAPIESAEAPLAGLRCIELCWIWSGPMVGQILADLGAEVIKVESPARFDLYRTRGLETMRGAMAEKTRIESSLYFHSLNRNKIGFALDLKQKQGLDIAMRLAACSDLLIENFTVGTMDRLGLGPAALGRSNPALIQLSMSGPGRGSAIQDLRSYGLVLSALAGAETLIRDGGEFLGSPTFSISDPNAAAFGAMAALAGVLAAREDGQGRSIDLSQIESAATLAGAPTAPATRLDAVVGTDDGRFVAISVPSSAFANRNELRRAFSGFGYAEIVRRCATLGGQTAHLLELVDTDGAPEFSDCPGWLAATHPYTGEEMLVAAPWRIEGRRAGLRKPAPVLGEGDDYVLRRVLSLSDAEIDVLTGVVGVSGGLEGSSREGGERRLMIDMLGRTPDATTLRDLVGLRASYGDKPLLICRDETLTYADADRLSNRVANRLREHGLGKGDVVATFMYNSIDQALIWFGCAKIGAIYAPLNVSLVKDDLAYSLDDTGARLLVVDAELAAHYNAAASKLARRPRVLVHGAVEAVGGAATLAFDDLLGGDEGLPDVEVKGTDPMAIVYTGGSTSMPKGVLVSHLYYIAAAIRYGDIAEATDADVHYANSHFFHIGGQQFGVTGPLYNGMTGVMEKWFSASNYWNVVRKHGATIIDPLGTMMAVLLRQPASEEDRRHKVRVGVGIASGQVRRDLRDRFEERFGTPMLEVYSMTEMGVLMCSERLSDRRQGSCGRPHGWAEVMVVDQDDNPVPAGAHGQILLRPKVPNTYMIRYVNKPEETIAAWRNLWYHSGDLGYVDQDGYVYFVGREAHWIRRRGENVSAFEVEKAITAHPAIVDCAVVGVPSELGEEDIKAYVQLADEGDLPTPADLIGWCNERIAYFKVPRYVEFVDSFPRTMTKNEIARHELRDRGIGPAWDRATATWIEG